MDELVRGLMAVGQDLDRGITMLAKILGVSKNQDEIFVKNGKELFEKDVMIRTAIFDNETDASLADTSTESGVEYMKTMTLLMNPGG